MSDNAQKSSTDQYKLMENDSSFEIAEETWDNVGLSTTVKKHKVDFQKARRDMYIIEEAFLQIFTIALKYLPLVNSALIQTLDIS